MTPKLSNNFDNRHGQIPKFKIAHQLPAAQTIGNNTNYYQRTPFIYQLNAHSLLVPTLKELIQHVSVHVYHLQGEYKANS
jgi:hypothetical protein